MTHTVHMNYDVTIEMRLTVIDTVCFVDSFWTTVCWTCVKERLRRESLEREKQIEQDRLNSKMNEKMRQEVWHC